MSSETFVSLAISASTRCPQCKQPIHLNGATDSTLCDACRAVVPTPPELWSDILGGALVEVSELAEQQGRSSTMHLARSGLTVEIELGRMAPRCEACKTPVSFQRLGPLLQSEGQLACEQCHRPIQVRPAPRWFQQVDADVVALVGETSRTVTAPAVDPRSVRFLCHNCGGKVPLDGEQRAFACPYCETSLTLPDDIWMRLHPATTRQRWFALLGGDRAAPGLPSDSSELDLRDIEVGPDGGLVVALHGDRGARMVCVDQRGRVVWQQPHADLQDAKLRRYPHDGTLVVVDQENPRRAGAPGAVLQFLDAETGEPRGTLAAKIAANDREELTIEGYSTALAFAGDGTLLVHRTWNDGSGNGSTTELRRFSRDGARLEPWPGTSVKRGLLSRLFSSDTAPGWDAIGHRPRRLPDDAWMHAGWDDCIYVYQRKLAHVAKLDRGGTLLATIRIAEAESLVDSLDGFGVARDGTVFALFAHATRLGGHAYPHVARVSPDGTMQIVLGPHGSTPTFIGRYSNKLRVGADGSLYLAYDLGSVRIVGPTGLLTWRSPATAKEDRRDEEGLENDRRSGPSA